MFIVNSISNPQEHFSFDGVIQFRATRIHAVPWNCDAINGIECFAGMRNAMVAVCAVAMLSSVPIFLHFENRFFRLQGIVDECPRIPPKLSAVRSIKAERRRQQAIDLFGIDPNEGPAGARRIMGPPQEVVDLTDFARTKGIDGMQVCSYKYDGLQLTFFNGLLEFVELTAKRWSFPIGVRVGDSELRVDEILGEPVRRDEFGIAQVQLTYQLSPNLVIETTRGLVTKILWY
jgi:hypothetical protein